MLNKVIRVLWLLNDRTLRKADITQLNALGVAEVFMPKVFPATPYNLSDDIDYSHDEALSIPAADLEVLNKQDWYGNASENAWEIVNRYFDVAFIGNHEYQLLAALKGFSGAIVLRGNGFLDGKSYSDRLFQDLGEDGLYRIKAVGSRFWFGAFYTHQADAERSDFVRRLCCLPIAYTPKALSDKSTRQINKVLFFCPNINTSDESLKLYKQFIKDFKKLDYSIAGQQPIAVDDEDVIGDINFESERCVSNQYKVLFYESTHPNRVDGVPLRAMQSGMPVVFLAGGMLDKLGGLKSPGRCKSIDDARKKIARILDGNSEIISSILKAQSKILEKLSAPYVGEQWQKSWAAITSELEAIRNQSVGRPKKKKRIAIIVPVKYRGGSLRGTKMLAQALYAGSREDGVDLEVVICHVDDKESYPKDTFDDVGAEIKIRPYKWRYLNSVEARRAMRYSGQQGWEPKHHVYVAPDDGIKQLFDCDLWIVISDRLEAPLLPVKPIIYMVYDYLQRYEPILTNGADSVFLDAVRSAKKVFVTTNFTKADALQYAGVSPEKVVVMPMLVPEFWKESVVKSEKPLQYFIWTTNANQHKNHSNALKALSIYYEEYEGALSCHVTGVGTENLLKSEMPHLKPLASLVKGSPMLRRRLRLLGELSESQYIKTLANSRFLWHAGKIDNGTFSVIEAACVGVPSLSSDYPAMREIDDRFALNLSWMDASSPREMAKKLKYMEEHCFSLSVSLPSKEALAKNDVMNFASKYWDEVRVCL